MSKKMIRMSAQDGQSIRTNASAVDPDKTVVAVNKQGTVLHLKPSGMSAIAKDTLLFVPTKRYTEDIIHLKHQRLNELSHTLLAGIAVEDNTQSGSA